MKINELLMNVHNKEFNLEKGLQVKKYLPMELKKTIAQGIIYDCTTEEDGFVRIDSVQRYMSYVKYMITMHTNLEYTDENYDVLCATMYGEKTLLNAIMDSFESDAKECSRILNLMSDDISYNNSIQATIAKFLFNLNGSLSEVIAKLHNKVDDENLNDVDFEKLKKFLNVM